MGVVPYNIQNDLGKKSEQQQHKILFKIVTSEVDYLALQRDLSKLGDQATK